MRDADPAYMGMSSFDANGAARTSDRGDPPQGQGQTEDGPQLDHISRDEEGFLLDPSEWHSGLIEPIAREMEIEMNTEQTLVVWFVRDYFETNQIVPEARTLLKYLRAELGDERGTRRYLYSLFPYGYGQQACKIAGMSKPRKLMLDV